MKKTFLTILVFALSFTFSFAQSGGDGTSGDPYKISTYADLQWLQTASSEWVADKYFIQTANINAAATATDGWNPIGNEIFYGTYDGGGFAIDSLTINGSSYVGFFQKTSSTTIIKNLGLTNVSITATGGYGAALVTFMDGGTVENCYSTGNIISNATDVNYNYAGLIARMNAGTVSDSYSEADISYLDFAPENVGGFVGYYTGSITNCYATGNVQGGKSVGGFVGNLHNVADITKCYSTGDVTASGSPSGGFAGYNQKGAISECYSTGNVSGDQRVGGFVGINRKAQGVISNCYSFGNVTGTVGGHVGGFCGRNFQSATIENCYSIGVCNDKGFVGASYDGTPVLTSNFFDSTASGNTDTLAAGRTTAEMKTESTFADSSWDLTSIWKVEGNYPNLINNENPDLVPVEITKEKVGQWDFDDTGNLAKATIGEDLEIFGAPTAVAGPTDNDGAVLVGLGDYFKAVTNLAQVGSDGRADTYTFQTDIKMPEVGQYNALLQVRTPNTSDATIFVYPAKSIGKSSYGISKPVIEAETWYRIIFSVEELKDINKFGINLYVNGTKVVGDSTQNLSSWISMADSVLFFTDNNGEVMPTDVSQIVLYNYALSSEEAAELGTPFKKEEVQDPLPKGTELIANYGFNDALNGWNFFSKDVGYADYSLDATGVINGPNSVKVNVDTTYNSYPSGRIALYTGVPIETGKKYYLTFKIKSNKVINDKAIWWSMYDSLKANSYYNGMWGQVTLDKDTTVKYEATFTADFTDATTDFSIDFAAIPNDSTTMWLDDIHLIKLAEPEPSGARSLSFNIGETRNEYLIAKDTLNFGLDSTWTMEGWFKFANFDAAGGEDHLMRLGAQLFVDGSNSLKVQAGGNYVAGTTELVTDKWYHIAYVRTLSNVTVYLDGVEEIVAAGADAGAEAHRFLIGSYGTPSASYNFAGTLDEIRLWNVARTEAEIIAAKEVELTGAEDGLVIYYNFNDGSDSTVVNIAGENYNGMLFNMADSNWSKDNPFERPIPPDELPLPEGTELLTNNYFNDGLTNWDLNLSVQSAATLVLDNSGVLESDNSAKVHVKSTYSSGSWKNQFRQTKMERGIIKGNSYHVQFQIKANKAISNIFAVLQQNHGSFSDIYSKEISLFADSTVTVVDTFVCAETDSVITWAFNLGTASVKDVDIWFDAVHLIDVGEVVGVEEETTLPKVYALQQNYPNPFNPTTVINFALPKASDVHLSVYNILGQKVTELVNGKMVAGNHSINFNAAHLASGVYMYRIKAGNFVSVKKMLLLK